MVPNPDNAAILAAIQGTGLIEQPSTFSTGLAPFNLQQPQQQQQQQQQFYFGQQQPQQQQLNPQQNNNYADTIARFFSGPNSTFGNIQNLHRSPVGSDGLQATHLRMPAAQRIFFGQGNT